MDRLARLNLQLAPNAGTRRSAAKRPQAKGNFTDCWSYLGMDEFVSAEARVIRDKCRVFAERHNDEMMDYVESSKFPHHLIPEIAKLGIIGSDMPKEVGGLGLNCADVGSMFFELAKKDASLATFALLHHSLGHYTVLKLAQPALRDKILKETMPLKKVLAWALTEPDNGSDASGLSTTAKKVEGGYLLTGRKRWIGNATFADLICVWARNEAEGGKIQCFLVRKGTTGLTTGKIERKMALRAVQNADIILRDVFVPDDERFELATDFASGTKEVLQHSRIFVAWIAAGMAAGACEAAFEYTKKRVQFGKPVAARQLIQAQLVKCVALCEQNILLCMQISRQYDRKNMTIGRIAMAKSAVTANCREVAAMARNVMGGNGILLQNQAIKTMADIEAIHTYEGSHEINVLVAGREMTGLSAIK